MEIGADSLRVVFMGMAEVTAFELGLGPVFSFSSGEGDIPAGVDMFSGKMNSSRFMGSACSAFWSDDFRN
jgi:hypothetical protein